MSDIEANVVEDTITVSVSGGSISSTVSGGQGPQGPAATISVGTVTTGDAGTSATVVNSGTSGAAVLDFTIPRGATGPAGATGATGATGPAGTTSWAGITDKPSTFTPASHSHGSITNDGYIGSVAGVILVTTTGGQITTSPSLDFENVTNEGNYGQYLTEVSIGPGDSLADLLVAIDTALSGKASTSDPRFTDARTPTSHTHAASDITSGTIAAARLPTASTTVSGILRVNSGSGLSITSGALSFSGASYVSISDSRLTDTRDPNAHALTHTYGGTDQITVSPLQITVSGYTLASATYTSLGPYLTALDTLVTGKQKAITISNASPSGGSDGDIWLKY